MNELVLKLLQLEQQLRIFHWQTKMYGRHIAYGNKYDSIGSLIDKFVEVYMGKAGERISFSGMSIELLDIEEVDVMSFLDETIKFLRSFTDILDSKSHSDLLNIRDEMMAEINQLFYLLSLK